MNNYLVTITILLPYPKDFEYRIKCTSFGTAANRASNLLRKEIKGRKIKEMKIRVIHL